MKRPAFQFYPADWLNDINLRMATHEEKGFLIDLMCLMHQNEPYGHLSEEQEGNLHRILSINHVKCESLLSKVVSKGLVSRVVKPIVKGVVKGMVYNKRMVRDEEIRQVRATAGRLGGNPNLINPLLKQTSKQKTTPSSSSSSSSSKPPISPTGGGVEKKKKAAKLGFVKMLKWFREMDDVDNASAMAHSFSKKYSDSIILKALKGSGCTSRSKFSGLLKRYSKK